MQRVRAGVVVLAIALLVPIPANALAPSGHGTRMLFHLKDDRIDESSGLGVGINSPNDFYMQNDSGDSARFFAVNRADGRTDAVYDVPGAVNHDWEDLAVSRDPQGVPSVYLGDIGDNKADRDEVQIYRVDEPTVTPGEHTTSRPDVWRLRYPDGPHNAETLAVSPDGSIYIATKSRFGHTEVFAVPADPDPNKVQTVKLIGRFQVAPTPSGAQVGQPNFLVTGGAISRDGKLFVLRTYTSAYVWRLRDGDVAAALKTKPTSLLLPLQPAGEGITVDGANLLIDSEGRFSAVWSVPVPPLSDPGPTSGPSASTSGSGKHSGGVSNWARWGGAGVVLIALVALIWWRRTARHS